MCVTLIGGMDRLKQDYMAAAEQDGHSLKFITRNERVRATSPCRWFTRAAFLPCVNASRVHRLLKERSQMQNCQPGIGTGGR